MLTMVDPALLGVFEELLGGDVGDGELPAAVAPDVGEVLAVTG
jgi:hypothetical protein